MEKNGKNASTFKQNRKRYNYEVEIIILFFLVALLSCQKVEKGYYKSGALRYERTLLNKEKKKELRLKLLKSSIKREKFKKLFNFKFLKMKQSA